MIVGDFRERNVGVETRTTATQEEGREMCKLDGTREQHSDASVESGKQVRPHFTPDDKLQNVKVQNTTWRSEQLSFPDFHQYIYFNLLCLLD